MTAADPRDEEAALLRRLARNPDDPAAWLQIGIFHGRADRMTRAITAFREALARRPAYPEALNGIGIIWASLQRSVPALAAFEQALSLRPAFAEAHYNMGRVLAGERRLALAEAAFREAVRHRPHYRAARQQLADLAVERNDHAEAVVQLRAVAAAAPADAGAREALAAQLSRAGSLEEAIGEYEAALALQPRSLAGWLGLGVARFKANRLDDAGTAFERAHELGPDASPVHHNLGLIAQRRRQIGKAVEHYRRAMTIDPRNAHARAALGMCQLYLGDFAEGWANYEAREDATGGRSFQALRASPRMIEWRGQEVPEGSALLVLDEQGLGDMVQFLRFVPALARRFARVLVECRPPLTRLFARTLGPGFELRGRGEALPPDISGYFVRIMSLPYALGVSADAFAAAVPYVEATAAERARLALSADGASAAARPRIGIAWAGNPAYPNDRARSLPFDVVAPLLALDARWISLQKGPPAAALAAAPHVDRTIDAAEDFADTAAIVDQLDLLVTADTAVGHLAGAMGRPVWLLNRHDSEWRWMLDRRESAWYPSMRIFTQPRPGDWPAVVDAVARAIVERWPPVARDRAWRQPEAVG
ncbi:MAG: tetratricopeptide repeat protein [Alphaproteobacteria bacterium]